MQEAAYLGRCADDLLEQRQDRIADDERPLAEAREVDAAGRRGGVDRSGGVGWDDPELGLHVRKCPLDFEPGVDDRLLGEQLGDLVVGEHVDER